MPGRQAGRQAVAGRQATRNKADNVARSISGKQTGGVDTPAYAGKQPDMQRNGPAQFYDKSQKQS